MRGRAAAAENGAFRERVQNRGPPNHTVNCMVDSIRYVYDTTRSRRRGGQPAATADVGLTVPLRLGLAGARSIGRDDPLPPLPFPPCDGRRRRALCVRGAFGVANTRVLIGAVFGGCRWWRGVLRGVHELRWRAEVHSSGRRCGLRGLPRQHVQSRRRPCDRVLRCASQQPTRVCTFLTGGAG